MCACCVAGNIWVSFVNLFLWVTFVYLFCGSLLWVSFVGLFCGTLSWTHIHTHTHTAVGHNMCARECGVCERGKKGARACQRQKERRNEKARENEKERERARKSERERVRVCVREWERDGENVYLIFVPDVCVCVFVVPQRSCLADAKKGQTGTTCLRCRATISLPEWRVTSCTCAYTWYIYMQCDIHVYDTYTIRGQTGTAYLHCWAKIWLLIYIVVSWMYTYMWKIICHVHIFSTNACNVRKFYTHVIHEQKEGTRAWRACMNL